MATRLLSRSEFETAMAPIDALRSVSAPTEEWSFALDDEEKMVARLHDGREFRITMNGMEAALTKVPGLSKAAIAQWPSDRLMETVNWFYEHGEGDVAGMIAEDRVVGFTKDARPIYPISDVLTKAEETLTTLGVETGNLQFGNVRADIDRAAFGLVTPVTSEPKVGDIVQSGIWFMHSPTSRKADEISPFVNRLVCTNGMISARSLSKWSWRGTGNLMEWVGESVRQSWTALDDELAGLHALTEQPLNGHATAVLEDIFERHHVPTQLRERVLEAAVDEADGTMYGIAQSFNRAANAVEDAGQMRNLLMVTGDIAAQTERCDSCFRAF